MRVGLAFSDLELVTTGSAAVICIGIITNVLIMSFKVEYFNSVLCKLARMRS
jgi:hypothetical protein